RSLAQGEVIGYMQPGEFNENCGVARQGSGQYHLHLGFPATRTLTLEGWTLNLRDHKFYKGAEARGVHSLFIAGEDSPVGEVMTMLGAEVGGGGQAQAEEEALPLDLQLWLEGRKGAVNKGWLGRNEGG
ncbi:MAG: hypothetical protein LLG44_12940, partial [Chloroflexi bacterium]|nr:hypothetical protein [Chloroflexota bacterium]